MSIGESFLPEFDNEMAGTRKALERVPEDKLDWKAHPKSHTIGWVANHLAEIPGWVEGTLTADVWDMNPEGGEPYRTPDFRSRKEILKFFDDNVAAARKRLASTPDSEFAKNWSLADRGQVLLTTTKLDVVRTWVINHTIHHRAFLCSYLRLNDIPVPGLYGPSGDEG
jgi:uncharacterized damage-inducible protein DinB